METITVHARFSKAVLKEISIDQFHSGTYQPRDTFSEESLESLTKTIAQLGVLEPLIVRVSPKNSEQYEIVAGERRWRAAKLAGLKVVPCLVANYSNEQAAQVALIENACREALNPIAEALAMRRLATEFQYTHEEVATLLGIDRAHVSNLIRLLNLDARIQHWMKQGAVSQSHGKVLASLPLEKQYWFAYEAVKKEWSVRVLEDAIKASGDTKLGTRKTSKSAEPTSLLEKGLTKQFGHSVKMVLNKNEAGHFRIHFHNLGEMRAILEKFGYDSAQESIAKECDETLASPLHAGVRSETVCEDA